MGGVTFLAFNAKARRRKGRRVGSDIVYHYSVPIILPFFDPMEDWCELVDSEDLRRKLTLDEYFANQVAELGQNPNPNTVALIRTRCKEMRDELEALAQPGDSWWEWIQGDEPLMQSGGLALVRGGQIVWAMQAWIS